MELILSKKEIDEAISDYMAKKGFNTDGISFDVPTSKYSTVFTESGFKTVVHPELMKCQVIVSDKKIRRISIL